MMNRPGLDFSFSGVKTHTRVTWEQARTPNMSEDQEQQLKADIAASFQLAVIDTLSKKCLRAIKQTGHRQLVISGGVSANQMLRETLAKMGAKHRFKSFFPALKYCTDNGAMIAVAGAMRFQHKDIPQHTLIKAHPRWSLEALS